MIFIHGCFWHGHSGCKYFVVPKTRTEWWLNNAKALKALKKHGWKIIILWECDLKPAKVERTLSALLKKLSSGFTGGCHAKEEAIYYYRSAPGKEASALVFSFAGKKNIQFPFYLSVVTSLWFKFVLPDNWLVSENLFIKYVSSSCR